MLSSLNSKQRARYRSYLAFVCLMSLFFLTIQPLNRPNSPALLNQTISSRLSGQADFDLLTGSNKPAPSSARLSEAYGKLPLSFEANKGQTRPEVKFLSRGSGYSLFLTSSEAVLALSVASTRQAVVRMKVAGANPVSRVEGLNELPTSHNYFTGNDPSKWRTDIPTYARVKYDEIYPGIDLVYYGNQQQLEYDFVVAPGADPRTIKLRFDGAESLNLEPNGDLILRTAGGELRKHKPVIYQIVDAPESRGQCMDGGWQQFGPPAGPFRNQGDCIRYFSIRLIR